MIEQMTLDGGGVEYSKATSKPRLTEDQRTLLRLLETRPVVTVVMVGRAIHASRGSECVKSGTATTPCCDECFTDGYRVAGQLTKRGILETSGKSRWCIAQERVA